MHNIALVAAVGALVIGILSLVIPFWPSCRETVCFVRYSAGQQYKHLQIPLPDETFFKRVYWSIAHAVLQDAWFRRRLAALSQQSLLSRERATVGRFFQRSVSRIVRAIESDATVSSLMREESRAWQHYKMPLFMVTASLLLLVFCFTSQILVAGP